ncbi:hypothetical protein GQR58_002367 [Nymphon striatum]|nr:hypothetical protein GQR58_002367 [Nymphon striatum]
MRNACGFPGADMDVRSTCKRAGANLARGRGPHVNTDTIKRNIRFRGRNQRNPDFRKMIENPDRKRTENDLSDQLLQDPDAVNASIDNMHPDGIIGSDFPDYSPVAGNLHLRNGRSLSFFTGYLYQRDIPYSVGANKAFLDSLAARRATVHVHHPGRNGINKNLVESGRLPRRGEKTIDEMLADRRRKEVREGRGENFGTVDEAAHLMAEHSYTYHPISGEYGVLRPPPERDDDAAASSSSATSQTTTSNAAAAAQSKVAPPAAESDDD